MADPKSKPKTKTAAKAKATVKAAPKAVKAKTHKKTEEPVVEVAAVEVEPVIDAEAITEAVISDMPLAKAGKRSAKAIKESEAKLAKEERKAEAKEEDSEEKPKVIQKPTRTHLERRGKKYRELYKSIDRVKLYPLSEALALVVSTSPAKFDATVEMHVRLGVDPKHADQNIRDNIILPAGTGKTLRVAVFADEKDIAAAKAAGADIAKGDEFLEQLEKNVIDFDVLIASPSVMSKLSKFARLLGPKGLMPNPKNGTVTTDTAKAVSDAKAGKVEYRIDPTGIVHLGIGKISFGAEKLQSNAEVVLASIKSNKPASVKANYVRSIFVSSSMGPSIALDHNL